MGFDIYSLIQAKEVREYLRKNRKFNLLEQEMIIRNSYYTIEQKLEFLRMLVDDAKTEQVKREEKMQRIETETTAKYAMEVLQEKVRLYEYIVNYIYNPSEDVMYVTQEKSYGQNIYLKNNAYRLSEPIFADIHYFKNFEVLREYWCRDTKSEYTVHVEMVPLSEPGASVWFDMRINRDGSGCIRNCAANKNWIRKQGFPEVCAETYPLFFEVSLPFQHGRRIKLQTPKMLEPVYGILDSYLDVNGRNCYLLWIEDENHDYNTLKKLLKENKLHHREVDVVDLSYPLLNICSEFLSYDWIEGASI